MLGNAQSAAASSLGRCVGAAGMRSSQCSTLMERSYCNGLCCVPGMEELLPEYSFPWKWWSLACAQGSNLCVL